MIMACFLSLGLAQRTGFIRASFDGFSVSVLPPVFVFVGAEAAVRVEA
jgi:hypothetical protein